MSIKIELTEWIERSSEIHKNKYNYNLVSFKNRFDKVIIICAKHGEFQQVAYKHMRGAGCKDCFLYKNKITKEDFVCRSNVIHHYKYDYSLSEMVNTSTKIKIICPIHHEFFQKPNAHLNGSGCFECGRDSCKLSNKKFIEKSNIIHNNKYDYSLCDYKKSILKVKIICCDHGEFKQSPYHHLRGSGCKLCGINKIKSNTALFINKAYLVHNYKYDYSLVNYIGVNIKIKIKCKFNHIFKQTPHAHLNGQGCSKCFNFISDSEISWLNTLNVKEQFRHQVIKINDKRYQVDAYNPLTNTVYEFYGDYWHGNPNVFNLKDQNKKVKKQFGQLFYNTIFREQEIKSAGYNMICIWEADFIKGNHVQK